MTHLEKAQASILAIVDKEVAKVTKELQEKLKKVTAERDAALLECEDTKRNWEEWLTDTIDTATAVRKALREEAGASRRSRRKKT